MTAAALPKEGLQSNTEQQTSLLHGSTYWHHPNGPTKFDGQRPVHEEHLENKLAGRQEAVKPYKICEEGKHAQWAPKQAPSPLLLNTPFTLKAFRKTPRKSKSKQGQEQEPQQEHEQTQEPEQRQDAPAK